MRSLLRLSFPAALAACAPEEAARLGRGGADARATDGVADDALIPDGSVHWDNFGYIASHAGDVDGDGHGDLVVAWYDWTYGDNDSPVYVHYGAAGGFDASRKTELTDWATSGYSDDGSFGQRAVAGMGDVNGDGYGDLLVSKHSEGDEGFLPGQVCLYHGSSAGPVDAPQSALMAVEVEYAGHFGVSAAGAGDVNGDGYDDLVVGAERRDPSGESSGQAFVYYGSAGGIVRDSEEPLLASDGAAGDLFGLAVAAAGDVDGDGYADVVVGSSPAAGGAIYVYYGSAAGIDPEREDRIALSDIDTDTGFELAAAGDVDGDGYGDVLVGSTLGYSGYAGAAYVRYGSAAGLDPAREDKLVPSDGVYGDWFGASVAGAGDVDGDGYADVIVGANGSDAAGGGVGASYVYYGAAGGIDASREQKLLPAALSSSAAFGTSVSGGGDIDGDGAADLLVSAPGVYNGGLWTDGAIYLFRGGPAADEDGDGVPAGDDCDDADGAVGEPAAAFADADGDGYGDPWSPAALCGEEPGYAAAAGDCDDGEAGVNPGAAEIAGDEIDGDCDGGETCYADADGDGYRAEATLGSADADCADPGEAAGGAGLDCDDEDAGVNPGAAEIAGDGADQDCDGADAAPPAGDSGDSGDGGDGEPGGGGEAEKGGCAHVPARPALGGALALLGLAALSRRRARRG